MPTFKKIADVTQAPALTKEEMLAMHFARLIDSEARIEEVSPLEVISWHVPAIYGDDEETVDMAATRQLESKLQAEYQLGKAMRPAYSMHYTRLGTTPYMADGSLSPAAKLPADCAGHVVMAADYIGTAQAYTVLYFRPLFDAVEGMIAAQLSDDDVDAWHEEAEATPNVQRLLNKYGEFAIWGSRDGSEPLTAQMLQEVSA